MTIFWSVFLGVIGAAFGSFVGAMTWRMKKGGKLWRGMWRFRGRDSRSICEKCRHRLAIRDLIPIFSWLFLRGHCRYCRKPIGWWPLILELIIAAAFVISYLFWPFDFATEGIILFVIWLLALVLFASLAVYDARWRLLPNKLVFPLIGLALVFAIVNYFFIQQVDFANFLINVVLGLLPIAGLYGLLFMVSRGAWVGFGDVKLGVAIGFLVPWQQGILVLILANFLGCLAILPLLIRKKLKPGSQIPFGPCLILATFIAVLFGQIIVDFARKNLLLM